jgi:hypothetical protein
MYTERDIRFVVVDYGSCMSEVVYLCYEGMRHPYSFGYIDKDGTIVFEEACSLSLAQLESIVAFHKDPNARPETEKSF